MREITPAITSCAMGSSTANDSLWLALGGIALLTILLDVAPKLGGWLVLLIVVVMLINAKKNGAI